MTVVCRVPRLKGDSLAQARTALLRNHCRVGRVTRPRRSKGRPIVVAQSHPHGARLPKGSTVALRLAL
ncbi:MAG: PASTA domain-containing protein [Solirubrobacteraceae bacterium]